MDVLKDLAAGGVKKKGRSKKRKKQIAKDLAIQQKIGKQTTIEVPVLDSDEKDIAGNPIYDTQDVSQSPKIIDLNVSSNDSNFSMDISSDAEVLASVLESRSIDKTRSDVQLNLKSGDDHLSDLNVHDVPAVVQHDVTNVSQYNITTMKRHNVPVIEQRNADIIESAGNFSKKDNVNILSNVRVDEVNLYPVGYKGEVVVLVDTSRSEIILNKSVKNGLFLWEKIHDIDIPGIKHIKAIGVTLYKIFFDTVDNANLCLANIELKSRNMRAFVPKSFLETFGVIRNIPLYLTDDEIKRNIVSPVEVASVYRFKKRSGFEGDFTPTFAVKIGFYGKDLPDEILLNYTVIKVDHYFPSVRLCRNCGRLGHTERGCRSGKRCLDCGRPGSCDPAFGILKCILCNGRDHNIRQRNKCNVWETETNIRKIMTIKKLNKREVLETFNPRTQNRFSIFEDYEDQFPSLPTRDNFGVHKNNDEEINRILTPHTYNSVVKKPFQRPIRNRKLENVRKSTPINHYNPSDYAWEGAMGGKVLERPNVHRVSLLEKTMSEFIGFMSDYFVKRITCME